MSDWVSRAKQVMPGGVSSPVRSLNAVGGNPIVVTDANGARLRTIDGRNLIDYCMSFGPLILGHAPEPIVKAIIEQVKKGTSYGTLSPIEVELAEQIVHCHPAIDWVRFVNSGTEAVMSAIRLARGKTGQELIVKFEGTYHGHADSMLVKGGSGLATLGISSSAGVPENVAAQTLVLPLGNKDVLKQAFEEFGEKIAAVIIEGVPANNGLLIQERDFLFAIQKECRKYGSLFILDEVITGFRLGLGGATSYYGLDPDIVTLGKIIGGGLPVGAYGGRKDLMEWIAPLGKVYQAGTLSGNPLAMTAGLTTLKHLEENPSIYAQLRDRTIQLAKGITEIFDAKGKKVNAITLESLFWMVFEEVSEPLLSPSQLTREAISQYAHFHQLALNGGIYLPPSAFEVAFLSTSHNEEIIGETLDIVERSLRT
ncbi:MAG: glutamate-1-semialdehyde 2,1-aminomutase [Methanobacteriota archaeon]|nr:MAG: glutamate-1-semialdehyde 2,1-aminomutase [Euryarchaeota archaeon]